MDLESKICKISIGLAVYTWCRVDWKGWRLQLICMYWQEAGYMHFFNAHIALCEGACAGLISYGSGVRRDSSLVIYVIVGGSLRNRTNQTLLQEYTATERDASKRANKKKRRQPQKADEHKKKQECNFTGPVCCPASYQSETDGRPPQKLTN